MNKNTDKQSILGAIPSNSGIYNIETSRIIPKLRSFTYTENISLNPFNVTIPTDTQVGDLLVYFAGCRDGRTQSSFTSGWTDIAVGLQNIFLRYKTAQLSDIGSVVGGTWSSNATGPAAVFVFNGSNSILATVQGKTSSGYTLTSPNDTQNSLAILFNQDRALNTRSPGLSEDLRTATISTSSYYTFQLERTTLPPYPTQTIGNVSSDSVGAYVVIAL
jgi:hypothetical protein